MSHNGLPTEELEALRRFDSCTLANAIESLNLRPRNEGFMKCAPVCVYPKLAPVAGFAVTGRMRAASPPVNGRCYYDHLEWWRYVQSVPKPRIVVMLDADDPPGSGALFGELHARICMAMHCAAYITNGVVRDLPKIEQLGFQLFAGGVSVSHAYAHVTEFGQPVEVGGLEIRSGDLLHADVHGVQLVPHDAVKRLPSIAAQILHDEQAFIQMCLDGNFSVERLSERIREHAERQKCK